MLKLALSLTLPALGIVLAALAQLALTTLWPGIQVVPSVVVSVDSYFVVLLTIGLCFYAGGWTQRNVPTIAGAACAARVSGLPGLTCVSSLPGLACVSGVSLAAPVTGLARIACLARRALLSCVTFLKEMRKRTNLVDKYAARFAISSSLWARPTTR